MIIEKPIGHDLASARAVNDAVGGVFDERQIYRIDHYLGKETVQNLMALRFGNALFEPLWNAAHIDHVQITVAESIGVEGRGGYYDHAGALRDMMQNHLMQLLCLVAMEAPTNMDADSVRDEKLKVLRALSADRRKQRLQPDRARAIPRRRRRHGRLHQGSRQPAIDDGKLHRAEGGNSQLALVRRAVSTCGQASACRCAARRSSSRSGRFLIRFSGRARARSRRTGWCLRIQPDEGVKLWLMIKDPGPGGMRLRYVPLDMSFAEAFGARSPDAYERLILDVIRGNQTLFMRRDEVEAAWAWIDPIAEAWETLRDAPKPYPAGTWGPTAAIALIERDGRTWYDDG